MSDERKRRDKSSVWGGVGFVYVFVCTDNRSIKARVILIND